MTSPYGFPAIGNQPINGAMPTTDTPPAATLLYNASYVGVTTNQIGPNVATTGYRYLLFLANLSAITAGSVEFRLRGVGTYYSIDIYKVTDTATAFVSESVGPGMQVPTVPLPDVYIECDVVTGPASFTVELWGWQ